MTQSSWSARPLPHPDAGRGILLPGSLLLLLGGLMVYSATVNDPQTYAVRRDVPVRHALWIGIGLALYVAAAGLDYRVLLGRSRGLLAAGAVLLLLVWIPGIGVQVRGARRWIHLGWTGQPSEFVKPLLILYLVDFCRRRGAERDTWRGLLPALGITGILALLVLAQPDFGTAVVILLTGLVVLWLGARSSGKIGAILLAALPVLLLLVVVEPYRLDRLVSFLHPERDPQGGSFQLNQSMDAFRRGGWTGVGLGRSEAPRGYVFSSYSDFVLSTLGEELGFLGVAAVLASYLWLGRVALRVSAHCPDPAGSHLALSCASLILMQAAVNVFVVAGLLPTKGLALPLVSYGGSSLIATLLLVGLIRSVARWGGVGFSDSRGGRLPIET